MRQQCGDRTVCSGAVIKQRCAGLLEPAAFMIAFFARDNYLQTLTIKNWTLQQVAPQEFTRGCFQELTCDRRCSKKAEKIARIKRLLRGTRRAFMMRKIESNSPLLVYHLAPRISCLDWKLAQIKQPLHQITRRQEDEATGGRLLGRREIFWNVSGFCSTTHSKHS